MADLFESIPVRNYGDDVDPSFWNTIRTYLIQAFPGRFTNSSTVSIDNNQSSYQDVSGLLLVSSSYMFYKIRYRIHREDAGETRDEIGVLNAVWDGSAWSYSRDIDAGNALGDGTEGGDYGTDYLYIVPATGQIQYKSSNMSGGSYSGYIQWNVIETWSA